MLETLRAVVVLVSIGGLLAIATYLIDLRLQQGWRLAILVTLIATGTFIWLTTELLSAFNAITFVSIAALWGCAALLLVWQFGMHFFAADRRFRPSGWRELSASLASLPSGLVVATAATVAFASILAVIAFAAAPNTWDAMTYHLARVMHWQQAQSLDFYATSIQRQLHYAPFAEMALLHLQVLAGGDGLANFVQYAGMLGSILGASLIARMLGGDRFAQIFAALATVTIPMGILQSTSAQTDYVVTLWVVCFVAFGLYQIRNENSPGASLLAGCSLGLAALTKATALLFTAPFGIWLAVSLIRRSGVKSFASLSLLLGCAILILLPHSLRNYSLYGNPLGPSDPEVGLYPGNTKTTNDIFSPAVTASNVLRNAGIELAVPSDSVNQFMADAITGLHRYLQLDVSDPRTTHLQASFAIVFSRHEVRASNPLQTVLIFIAAILLVASKQRSGIVYLGCVAAGFVIFCFVLKWQPWNTRLLLPLYVLAMPATALGLSGQVSERSLYIIMLMLTAVAGIAYLFLNPLRPLLGPESVLQQSRWTQYFADRPELLEPYNQAGAVLATSKCDRIGLASGEDDWEYPVWVMTDAAKNNIEIEHIEVANASASYASDFAPCAILAFQSSERGQITYRNTTYLESFWSPQLSVFLSPVQSP